MAVGSICGWSTSATAGSGEPWREWGEGDPKSSSRSIPLTCGGDGGGGDGGSVEGMGFSGEDKSGECGASWSSWVSWASCTRGGGVRGGMGDREEEAMGVEVSRGSA